MQSSTMNQNKTATVISVISDVDTPVSVFHKLSQPGQPAFLFESTEGDSRLARFSFIGIDPLKTISFAEGTVTIVDRETGKTTQSSFSNPLDIMRETLEDFSKDYSEEKLPFPFSGGLVGYMGYAATQYFENIAQQDVDPHQVPEGLYGLYDCVVVFDHQYRRIHVVSRRGADYGENIVKKLMATQSLQPLFTSEAEIPEDQVYDNVTGPVSREKFLTLVEKCKDYIREGQTFQIVLSHRFTTVCESGALAVYRVLQSINPSPYAYFLRFPGFDYVGSSPETFVRCQNGEVTLRAIAGTRPRGVTPEEDAQLEVELKANEKEMAEHHMLVDLGRNDLGRICKVGSIKVGEIATLTRYTHVMHLATEITGALRADKTCFSAFQSCFPRGTVSGAPKVRAMQLLYELEPERRGVYSGVVGYFDFHGNMDGAIAIRSTLIKDGNAHVNAGAGIVLDSDPEGEYQETRNKARSVIKAIKLADLIIKKNTRKPEGK